MIQKITKKTFLLVFALLLNISILTAQTQTPLDAAMRYMEQERHTWNLSAADIADLSVSDMYRSKHNDMTHIYFIQQHEGIQIYNAINGIHVASTGKTYHVGNRFYADIDQKVNTTTPSINAEEALMKAMEHLNIDLKNGFTLVERVSAQEFVYKGEFASNDINIKLRYQPNKAGALRLAWDLGINAVKDVDFWSMRVDAVTGDVLDKNNWTTKCKFVDNPYHRHDEGCSATDEMNTTPVGEALAQQNTAIMAGTYNVFGEIIEGVNVPHESPIHGNQNLLVDPHDVTASPYGWHDINGVDGPEYTITRGNNVWAYLDLTGQNNPEAEAEGGEELIFDFPYDEDNEPADMQNLAVTNLFYMVNTMHDFAYAYGMDEPAGAFQQNNYGNGGQGGDPVRAEGQDAIDFNNANFATPPDGSSGVMQMYLWNSSGGKILTVDAPGEVAGNYESPAAGYGPAFPSTPIVGEVVIGNDGTQDGTWACNELINKNMDGKVALVDRGGCFFEEKTMNAQAAGAIAIIVCNYEDDAFAMAGGIDDTEPDIPSLMIKASDCARIRAFADGGGLVVSMSVPEDNGPALLDGDLDNGIIAHEFAHGISNRLAGGPGAAGCLGNAEQMGEGWSDFFSLVTSVKPGDTGETPRGVGTYANREDADGGGIRRQPYTTDMSISTFTFGDVVRSPESVHDIGEIWNTMIWDMYWAFVEEYGFNIDRTDMTAGNNMAIQLVMDGMKMMPCSPGFVDGRDAILMADNVNNEGANQCLIWEVFARRGLGYSADQGTSQISNDGTEAFDPLPTCVKELKITKVADELVNAGEDITYTITVTNHIEESVSGVIVTDEIPAGCTYVAGSASNNGTMNGGMVTWELGDMATGDVVELTYKSTTNPFNPSSQQFFDDMEGGNDNWAYLSLQGENSFGLADLLAYSGSNSQTILNIESESDAVLWLFANIEVQGDNPTLRFYHFFDTEIGADGGFVEYSLDEGNTWFDFDDRFIRNGYTGQIQYTTFTIPFLEAFYGNSGGFIPSYVDLSEFIGENMFVRWRFGTDANTAGNGWYIDDVEVMDMVNYNSEACVTATNDGGMLEACVSLDNIGTVIQSEINTAVDDPINPGLEMSIFPNPANDVINVSINSNYSEDVLLELTGIDGRTYKAMNIASNKGTQSEQLDVSNLAAGFYLVKITTPKGIAIEKVVID